MNHLIPKLLISTSFLFQFSFGKTLSDAQIKKLIINESISSYSGNCPCPYNSDRAGRRCGKRSAYNRPGGASPICYDKDITSEMIQKFKENLKLPE